MDVFSPISTASVFECCMFNKVWPPGDDDDDDDDDEDDDDDDDDDVYGFVCGHYDHVEIL